MIFTFDNIARQLHGNSVIPRDRRMNGEQRESGSVVGVIRNKPASSRQMIRAFKEDFKHRVSPRLKTKAKGLRVGGGLSRGGG